MKRCYFIATLSLIIYLAGCAYHPYRATNRSYRKQLKAFTKTIREIPAPLDSVPPPEYWVGTTNFNLRRPNFVIIHHTAQTSCDQTLKTFTQPRTQVSAHYVICKDGTVHHMLNDYLRAWHGGVSRWGNLTDINSASIGIELDNNGYEPFTYIQVENLVRLLNFLKSTYSIPTANFIGHADIAPTRKNDPNINFPWQLLATKGFGSWYADTTNVIVPASFNNVQALRIMGYDVRDSVAAITAFKRHFVKDSVGVMNISDRKILYTLTR